MSHAPAPESERWPLMGLLGLVVLSVVVIFTGRLTGSGLQERSAFELVETRSVAFEDRKNGDVAIVDTDTGETIAVYGAGEGGFVRTALRAIVYSRKMSDIGPEPPMVIGRADDGRIVLHDPSTNKTVGISAFGDVHTQQFADLLNKRVAMND